MPPGLNLIGKTFGMLTVISMTMGKQGRLWHCLCSCGNMKEKPLTSYELKSGKRNHCGCVIPNNGRKTHGQCNSKLYKVWSSMKRRCSNPRDASHANYGGRGILYCKEWQSFGRFYEWAVTNGYVAGLTLERVNNDGNYEPSNCKWIPKKDQSSNTRRCIKIEYMGQVHNIKDWSKILNIPYSLLQGRLKHGWSVESAFNTPVVPVHLRHSKQRTKREVQAATGIPTVACA